MMVWIMLRVIVFRVVMIVVVFRLRVVVFLLSVLLRILSRPVDSALRIDVYDVIVTATSGTGGRVRTIAQGVTVTVVDVDEAPSAPGLLLFLSSPSSLRVCWLVGLFLRILVLPLVIMMLVMV